MPLQPLLTTPFSNPGLLALVLSNPTFASRGYIWGFDGRVHYCFLNPDKVHFEIWKKRFHYWTLGFGTLFVIYKHYQATAEDQPAAVVTNGPQMRLPFNMSLWTVRILVMILFLAPTIAGAFIGGLIGSLPLGALTIPGSVIGGLVGALVGSSLVYGLLFILGLGAKPYGAVATPLVGVGENVPADPGTYFLGRSGLAFSTYAIGPGNPTGMTWGSGGLTLMISAGASAGTLGGSVGATYLRNIGRVRFILWGLIKWNPAVDTILERAIDSQIEAYGSAGRPVGLLIVAGADPWTNADTLSMITHKTIDAVATDGSDSGMLGSSGEIVIENSRAKDLIQRYGFMCVPE